VLDAAPGLAAAAQRAARSRRRRAARGGVLHEAEHAADRRARRPGPRLEPARTAAPAVSRGLLRAGGRRDRVAASIYTRLVDLLPVHVARVPFMDRRLVDRVLARRSVP